MSYQFIKYAGAERFWTFLACIVSPFVLAGLGVISFLFSPISIATKGYIYFREEKILRAIRELIYPKVHPIFDAWLKQTSTHNKKFIKKGKRFLSEETTDAYQPPLFTFDDSFNDHRTYRIDDKSYNLEESNL